MTVDTSVSSMFRDPDDYQTRQKGVLSSLFFTVGLS